MPTSEKPILMSAPMVNAILSGAKTQTRRVVSSKITGLMDTPRGADDVALGYPFIELDNGQVSVKTLCPYGKPGDTLWVKETWFPAPWSDGRGNDSVEPLYRADAESDGYVHGFDAGEDKWKPSIFMPRWASRITLKVESVRVQRLQDISDDDCRAEGVFGYPAGYYKGCWQSEFSLLWDSINKKKHPWSSNPFCWAITFSRIGL